MIDYTLNKIFYSLLTLLGVATVVFFLFNILPGDPTRMMLDQREDPEQLALIRKKLGFDQPKWKQYGFYLNDLSPVSIHSKNPDDFTFWDSKKYAGKPIFSSEKKVVAFKAPYLRESFQMKGQTVWGIIAKTLPNTFILAISTILIGFSIGIILGIISALNKDSIIDQLVLVVSSLGMSVPSFFSAVLFAWLFAFVLQPITGLNMTGNLYEIDDLGRGKFLSLKNLILPAITLGIRPLAVITQLTRNSLLEVLSQDYIRTAKAKGLSGRQIVFKHALKNALNPVVTAASGWLASLLAGAVFVEYVFGWNGLGKEIVNALNSLDLPVVMGAVLVIATVFIVINILVDIIYAILDPKIRKG